MADSSPPLSPSNWLLDEPIDLAPPNPTSDNQDISCVQEKSETDEASSEFDTSATDEEESETDLEDEGPSIVIVAMKRPRAVTDKERKTNERNEELRALFARKRWIDREIEAVNKRMKFLKEQEQAKLSQQTANEKDDTGTS